MLIGLIINILIIAMVVGIHYETLSLLSRQLPRWKIVRPRERILISIFVALVAHIIEVCVFALGYYFKIKIGGFGSLQGNYSGSILDSIYFSFTTYTSLGFGDIEPIGLIRILTGLEALTGLVLITWTASFIFLEMERNWKNNQ